MISSGHLDRGNVNFINESTAAVFANGIAGHNYLGSLVFGNIGKLFKTIARRGSGWKRGRNIIAIHCVAKTISSTLLPGTGITFGDIAIVSGCVCDKSSDGINYELVIFLDSDLITSCSAGRNSEGSGRG